MTRKSFTKTRERASCPCEIVHANLIYFSEPTFSRQNRYLLNVADDYTRYLQIFLIKSKTEVSTMLDKALLNLKTMFHPQFSFPFLRVDNGTEFENYETERILRAFEIQYQHSEPYDHENMGFIKRLNRMIQERIRALLFMSGFPSSF